LQAHPREAAPAEACVAGHLEAGSLVEVAYLRSHPFLCRVLVSAVVVAVAAVVAFRTHRCAVEVAGSSQAARGDGLG
jgi:hypothetical protein